MSSTQRITRRARRIALRMNRTQADKIVYFDANGAWANTTSPDAEVPHPINWTYAVESTDKRMTQIEAQKIVDEADKTIFSGLYDA